MGRRQRLGTRMTAVLAALTLIVTATAVGAPTASALSSSAYSASDVIDYGIDNASRDSVDAAYRELMMLGKVETGWTGASSRCVPGQMSQAANSAAFNAINWMRELAGLDPVVESQAASKQAQAAALIMTANWTLTHHPTATMACYSEAGRAGAGTANLTMGSTNVLDGVLLQMYDPGASNLPDVGHRRWLLMPTTRTMGVGQAGDAGAVVVFGSNITTVSGPDDRWIPWPAAGYFPAPLVPATSSWSLSRDGADFSSATVSVTKNGRTVKAVKQPIGPRYGVDSIVFTVDGDETAPSGTAVDRYVVTVNGIRVSGTVTAHSYTVNVFAPKQTFVDVPRDYVFFPEVEWLAGQGISNGWDVGGGRKQYRPHSPVLRDQMAAFLYRAAGSPAYTAPRSSPFVDVPTTYVFYKEIAWLASTGISTGWDIGDGNREYRPRTPVLRDQMAAFLYRFAESPDFSAPPTSTFVDVSSGYVFGKEIAWLAGTGITTGWQTSDGRKQYRPWSPVLRDQMAAFLYRYAER